MKSRKSPHTHLLASSALASAKCDQSLHSVASHKGNLSQVSTDSLRPPPNSESRPPSFIDNLAHILSREGFKAPILIDERRNIRSGVSLWLAAQHLGLSEVPVVWLDRSRGRRPQR